MECMRCIICVLLAIALVGCSENEDPAQATKNCEQPAAVACTVQCEGQGTEYDSGFCDGSGQYNCTCRENKTSPTSAVILVNSSDNSSVLVMMRSGSMIGIAPLAAPAAAAAMVGAGGGAGLPAGLTGLLGGVGGLP